jgi:hypothetical protein
MDEGGRRSCQGGLNLHGPARRTRRRTLTPSPLTIWRKPALLFRDSSRDESGRLEAFPPFVQDGRP